MLTRGMTGSGGGKAARTVLRNSTAAVRKSATWLVVHKCADKRSENSPGFPTQSTSLNAGDSVNRSNRAITSLRRCTDSALMNVNCASTSSRSAGNFQS